MKYSSGYRNTHMQCTALPLKAILRVQPVQDYGNTLRECDSSNNILWQGLLHVILPEVRQLSHPP
jgi:hypothetical protein